MAKFNELFAHVAQGKTPADSMTREEYDKLGNTLYKYYVGMCLRGTQMGPCWICGELSEWIEISFEACICSEECNVQAWENFEKACREADLRSKNSANDSLNF